MCDSTDELMQLLDEIGREPLKGSGFEDEFPDLRFGTDSFDTDSSQHRGKERRRDVN